jgi:hypothetical protein
MKLAQLSLRELFWLVLVCALACALWIYGSHRLTLHFVRIAQQAGLVLAIGVIAGRYVTKTPFSAGFIGGLGISLLFALQTNTIFNLLAESVLPDTQQSLPLAAAMGSAADLAYGLLAGTIAVVVARMEQP